MKQKLSCLMLISAFAFQFLQGAEVDFDDTPVSIIFTASPEQYASIASLDQQAYRNLMKELIAFQYRVYDNLLQPEELPVILKNLYIKSQLLLADKDSQDKFRAHLRNVAGHHRIQFVE